MEKKTLIVIGSGPGLGNAVAKEFASHDFRVVLVSRNQQHLDSYKKEFETESIEVYTKVADAARPETLTAAIHEVVAELGTPDVLVYNVAITEPDGDREITSDLLLQRYQIDVASAYHCTNVVATEEFAAKKGVIIYTGGASAKTYQPATNLKPLRMDKAALNQMNNILHHLLLPRGIFVGSVLVGGAIRPGDVNNDPGQIAKLYWKMYVERNEYEILSLSTDYDPQIIYTA